MAIFNPEQNPLDPQNYLSYSKGTDRAQGDSSLGVALRGAGDLIGAVAKGTSGVAQINIEDQLRSRVAEERDPITKPYEDIGTRGGPTVGGTDPNAGLSSVEEGPYIPHALNSAMQPMNKLVEANNQGKLDSAYYAARLQGIVRDVKSQFPGYESVVDEKIKDLTGIIPANFLANEVFKNSELQKSQVQKERDQIRTELRSHIDKGNISPETLRQFDAGQINQYQALNKIYEVTKTEADNQKERNSLALAEAQNKDIVTAATQHANDYAGRMVSNRVTAMLDTAGGVGQLFDKIQKSQQPGGVKMSPQEMVEASNAIQNQKTLAQTQLRAYYTAPMKELGGRSIQSYIGAEKVKGIIEDSTKIFDTFSSNIGFEKQGIAASAGNFIQVTRDQNLAGILPKSNFLQNADIYTRMGGQAGFGAYMERGGGIKDLDQHVKAFSDFVHFGTAANDIKNANEMADKYKEFQQKFPDKAGKIPMQYLLGDAVGEAIDPKTTPEIARNQLKVLFNDGSKGFVSKFENQDRMELWNMLTTPAVSNKIQELSKSDPTLMKDYQNWAREEFLVAFKGQMDFLQDHFSYNTGIQTSFDPTRGYIYMNDTRGDSRAVKAEVDKINVSLMNWKKVLEVGGYNPNEIPFILQETLAKSGFNPNVEKQDDIVTKLGKAIWQGISPYVTDDPSKSFSNSFREGGKLLLNTVFPPAGASELQASLGNQSTSQSPSLAKKIIQAESGGNPNAKASSSSATGAGQFIKETWLRLMKENKPDLVAGKSDKQILALRNDPVLSGQMVDAYAEENSKIITKAGFKATPGNQYLAHFAGGGGAIKILKANPSASAAEVLGPEATKANPWLRRFTTEGLIHWAENKVR